MTIRETLLLWARDIALREQHLHDQQAQLDRERRAAIIECRRAGVEARAVADIFGISTKTVQRVVNGRDLERWDARVSEELRRINTEGR